MQKNALFFKYFVLSLAIEILVSAVFSAAVRLQDPCGYAPSASQRSENITL